METAILDCYPSRKFVFLLIIISILVSCSNSRPSAKQESILQLDTLDISEIDRANIRFENDGAELQIFEPEIKDLVKLLNTSKPKGLCKFSPELLVTFHFKNGGVRDFRVSKNLVKEKNDFSFEIRDTSFFNNLKENFPPQREKRIPDEVLAIIQNHFQTIIEPDLHLNTTKDMYGTNMYYTVQTNNSSDWAWDIHIPWKIIRGDMTNDGFDDILVPVRLEGGGVGGNIGWQELFLFKRTKVGYILLEHIENTKLVACEDGYFYPEYISNNVLFGEENCYTDDDPRCCPSIKEKAGFMFRKKFIPFNH